MPVWLSSKRDRKSSRAWKRLKKVFKAHIEFGAAMIAALFLSTTIDKASNEGNDEENHKDPEEPCGNGSRTFRDAAKAEESGDNSNDKKDNSPIKHLFPPLTGLFTLQAKEILLKEIFSSGFLKNR